MSQADTWGMDPQVRAMRAVFQAMEEEGQKLLSRAGISPQDPRLRAWRDLARDLFSAAWPRAMRQDLARDPQGAGRLYLLCLARVLKGEGVEAMPEPHPGDDPLSAIIEKAAP